MRDPCCRCCCCSRSASNKLSSRRSFSSSTKKGSEVRSQRRMLRSDPPGIAGQHGNIKGGGHGGFVQLDCGLKQLHSQLNAHTHRIVCTRKEGGGIRQGKAQRCAPAAYAAVTPTCTAKIPNEYSLTSIETIKLQSAPATRRIARTRHVATGSRRTHARKHALMHTRMVARTRASTHSRKPF